MALLTGAPSADLRGALNNDAVSYEEKKQIEEEARQVEATAKLREEDYQLAYAVDILKQMPRTKISVEARRVSVVTMADSHEDKRNLETQLARKVPDGVRLSLTPRSGEAQVLSGVLATDLKPAG